MPKMRIGRWQILTLFANLVFGKAIGFSSEVMARQVGNDAWLSMIIAFLIGVPLMALSVWVAARFGEEGPERYIPRMMGHWLGTPVLLVLALFFFGSYITSAITMQLHINDYLMTETPLLVFVLLYALLCIYGAFLGAEVVARLSVLGIFGAAGINFLMVIGSFDHFEADRLAPLLDHGVLNVTLASSKALPDVAMATLSALILWPLAGKPKGWYRFSLWGLALGAVFTVLWPVFEIGVLGPEVTAQYLIACMQMARAAELSIYLHRYDMIMVVFWAYSVITQSMILLYAGCELTGAALPWAKKRRGLLILVLGLLTVVPNYLLAYDRDRYGIFLDTWWPAVSIPVAIGIPLLLCAVALFKAPRSSGPGSGSGKPGGAQKRTPAG